MANERNTELLALHLEYGLGLNPRRLDESDREWCRRLAEWLIDTSPHDELLACDMDQESRHTPIDRAEVARAVRDRLERFARGEV
jgi:hypothetical protein